MGFFTKKNQWNEKLVNISIKITESIITPNEARLKNMDFYVYEHFIVYLILFIFINLITYMVPHLPKNFNPWDSVEYLSKQIAKYFPYYSEQERDSLVVKRFNDVFELYQLGMIQEYAEGRPKELLEDVVNINLATYNEKDFIFMENLIADVFKKLNKTVKSLYE